MAHPLRYWFVQAGKHKLDATLETARGEMRVFKRLDVAMELLFGLGVGKVEVVR